MRSDAVLQGEPPEREEVLERQGPRPSRAVQPRNFGLAKDSRLGLFVQLFPQRGYSGDSCQEDDEAVRGPPPGGKRVRKLVVPCKGQLLT